jgi:hypothetical protein
MAKIDLTQSDVNKYLATIDEFWDTFHKGLKAPFSLWNENKEDSKESWIKRVGRTNELVSLLNLIFKNTPLLKGEFPVGKSRFMILTNYRLFINMDTGLVIIPLKDLTFFGEDLFHGERVDETSTIEYKQNGETLIIRLSTYMGGGYVEKTKRAGEYNDLDDLSQSLLSMTHYDYEKKNLNPQNFELLKTNSPISSLFSIINVKKMNMKKWLYLGIGLFFLVYLFSGGANVPDGQKMFIDKWQRLKDVNDTSGGKKHLKDNRSKIEKWYGKFVKHKSTISGDIILVKHDGIEYNLSPEIPLEGLDNNVKSIKEGDKVYFTGTLNGERSLTNSGALDEPEMLVKCTKLTNIDMNIVYFEITQEEINEFRLAELERKKEAERRSRMCELDGCNRDGNGWNYYAESQGTFFGYESIGCLKKYTTGGYCSKKHCAQGL